jgi:hypothetical protein
MDSFYDLDDTTAFGRSPVIATNAMNDTVAELRSRPYQIAHVRSATNQNGSTVVDDDARKSDYKRIVSNNTGSGIGQTSGTQNVVVSRRETEHTRDKFLLLT